MSLDTPLTSSRTRIPCAARPGRRRAVRRFHASLGVAILAWGVGWGCDAEPGRPEPVASTDGSGREPEVRVLEGLTENGHYRVRARPAVPPVALHRMHDWVVGIELAEPSSEIPTAVHFDGGMPAHGHGFVTRPRVTRNLGNGEFLVEGVKFHMPGDWVLLVSVVGRSGSDQVRLPLTIGP